MPESFKLLFPKTRVVIDCTEIAVQAPSSLVLRSELYSSYKGRTTFKCLVGVTAVSFYQAACMLVQYWTNTSRKFQAYYLFWECGDVVMADKGFLIEDLLLDEQCSLVLPTFLAQKGQFSESEARHNKLVSNLRVHVERANRRFKEFHLFDCPIHLTLAGTVKSVVGCGLLAN